MCNSYGSQVPWPSRLPPRYVPSRPIQSYHRSWYDLGRDYEKGRALIDPWLRRPLLAIPSISFLAPRAVVLKHILITLGLMHGFSALGSDGSGTVLFLNSPQIPTLAIIANPFKCGQDLESTHTFTIGFDYAVGPSLSCRRNTTEDLASLACGI